MKQALVQKLLALFCLGFLVFSFPLLTLWDRPASLWGLPLLPLGLFGVWALLIAALALIMEREGG